MDNGHLSIEEIEQLIQQKGPAEYQTHVESCQQCWSLLEKSRAFSARLVKLASVRIEAGNAMRCPDERVWFDVAAGTLAQEESIKHVQHAAECPSCGQRLKAATEMFDEELSPEEKQTLAALPSSERGAQRDLAERIAGVSNQPRRSLSSLKAKRSVWRPLSYAFATVAVFVLVAFLSLSFLTNSLLARGYRERSTLELRIAEAEPPREGTRGPDEEKERPASLVVADLLIRTRLALRPKSPYWLGEKGRLELIEGRSSALDTLKTAHALNPNSKTIAVDLASAMVVHFNGHGQASELFEAEELLLSVLPAEPNDVERLKQDSDNLVAVYNLAILYEKTGSMEQATREWETYLKIDSNSSWAAQARDRLERLRKQKRGQAQPSQTATLAEWQAYLDSRQPGASEVVLEMALTRWLPERHSSRMPNRGLSYLEQLLLDLATKLKMQHKDTWLSGLLMHRPSAQLDHAFRALREAILKNNSGEFREAADAANRAKMEFRRLGSFEGLARASLEAIYSYQRAVRSHFCVREGEMLEHVLSKRNFAWIQIQLYLDRASCLNAMGRFREARTAALDGVGLAKESDYKILSLRAKGIEAGLATTRGDKSAALAEDSDGLREFWTGEFPVERAHQFYSDITFNTEGMGLWHVTYDADQEAVTAISQSARKELLAVARYRLAKAAIMLGSKNVAEAQVREADKLFANLPQNATTLTYKADAIVGLSRAHADIGDYQTAVTLLQRSMPLFPPLESRLISKRLFQLNGDIALNNDRLPEAGVAYASAIDLAEASLSGLKTPYDRLKWNRENVGLYKSLIEVKIRENDSVGALSVWEAYKGVLVQDRQRSWTRRDSRSRPILGNLHLQMAPSYVMVSYALLAHGLIAWVLDQHGVTTVSFSVSAERFVSLAREFATECANPDSDLRQLQAHARELYLELLAPLAEHLTAATTLVVETDPDVNSIPFEALITDSGQYLIDRMAVLYSPGLDFVGYLRNVGLIEKSDKALIIGSPQLSPKWTAILGPLPSAYQEIDFVAKQFTAPVVLNGAEASRSLLVRNLYGKDFLHFAGHSVHTGDDFGILLTSQVTGTASAPDFLDIGELPLHDLVALKFVVLSACATGTADRTGFYRFVEPFFVARVPQALVARWNINSPVTVQFMQEFYSQLLSGQGASLAVQIAMNRQRTRTSHPYYWAAFALMGNY